MHCRSLFRRATNSLFAKVRRWVGRL